MFVGTRLAHVALGYCLLFEGASAFACGFKFVGKGGKIEVPQTDYPVKVVLVQDDSLGEKQEKFAEVLKAIGHDVTMVKAEALGSIDASKTLLMVTLQQVLALKGSLDKFAGVLPIVETQKESREVPSEYDIILVTNDFIKKQLNTIDEIAEKVHDK